MIHLVKIKYHVSTVLKLTGRIPTGKPLESPRIPNWCEPTPCGLLLVELVYHGLCYV